jgi:hypothetical protein
MGEVPGEDGMNRGDVADTGVGISVGELAEPDDSLEETDMERGLPRGNPGEMIGMGLEETIFSVGVRLFDMMVEGKQAKIPNLALLYICLECLFRATHVPSIKGSKIR